MEVQKVQEDDVADKIEERRWHAVKEKEAETSTSKEKLFSSKNKTEALVGKKLKIDMLPEIEKVHKKKERLLKKQHREALLLDNYLVVDELAPGRSLRDRKRVTYTFDDFDRSINEAIKVTKQKQPSPEPMPRRESAAKTEALTNGNHDPSHASQDLNFGMSSPESPGYDDEEEEDYKTDTLDRSNRRRQRPKRYSENEFIEEISDNETGFDSDDDIVGEVVYDEEYLKKRKQRRKHSSSSEEDEEYQWDEDNVEEEEEDDDDDEDSLSISEDSDKPHKVKQLSGRTRRGTKLRSVDEIQSGLRRSKRSTRTRIDYRQYEASESETDNKPEKSNVSADHSDPSEIGSENAEYMMESEDSGSSDEEDQGMKVDEPVTHPAVEENEQNQPPEKSSSPGQEEVEGTGKRRFLDLNEIAPSSGFDDGPNTIMKDEDNDY